MSERQIDDAIDEAVRDLMNVDADPAFRARVVERLRRPKPRGGFWRQLSVAAAALAVIIAFVLMRSGPKPAVEERAAPMASTVPPQRATETGVRPAETTEPAPRQPALRTARQDAGETTHQIRRGSLVATVADVPAEPIAGDVAPLDDVSSIVMEPLVQAPIATPEVAIAPLAPLSGIVIAPLDPRRERD